MVNIPISKILFILISCIYFDLFALFDLLSIKYIMFSFRLYLNEITNEYTGIEKII